jgi:pilus assembly protein CpaC
MASHTSTSQRRWLVLIPILLCLLGCVGLQAGQAAPQAAATPQIVGRISVTAGRSTVLETTFDVTRIAVTNPAIADAVVVTPREVLIDGKAAGTISLIVWGGDRRTQYEVFVEPPMSALEQQLRQLFPSEDIHSEVGADSVVLSGRVSSTQTMLRALDIARAVAPKANIVNLLRAPGATDAQQVMLQVRFAEVNRRALTNLGASLFTGAAGYKDWTGRSTTQQFSAPDFDQEKGGLVFSDFLNLFLFNNKYNMGAVIKALKETGYFQSLAEPNLIAFNGQEASFLAGGEVPVPVVQGVTQAVSILFKEFGVRLTFKPTITGDTIRLHVRPEVSSLDFSNGIMLQGFRIPAFTTRRAETEVELRDGQSFAIAGLIDNQAQAVAGAVPLLSQIPIIGSLFKSKSDRKERTELLVLVTPRLVRPLNPEEVPPLPTLPGRFLPVGDDIGEQLEGGGGTIDAPPAEPAPARASSGR